MYRSTRAAPLALVLERRGRVNQIAEARCRREVIDDVLKIEVNRSQRVLDPCWRVCRDQPWEMLIEQLTACFFDVAEADGERPGGWLVMWSLGPIEPFDASEALSKVLNCRGFS